MNAKMKVALEVRDETYSDPPSQRCDNCKHFWRYSSTCQAIEDRGRIVPKNVHPGGTCRIWTEGTK